MDGNENELAPLEQSDPALAEILARYASEGMPRGVCFIHVKADALWICTERHPEGHAKAGQPKRFIVRKFPK